MQFSSNEYFEAINTLKELLDTNFGTGKSHVLQFCIILAFVLTEFQLLT